MKITIKNKLLLSFTALIALTVIIQITFNAFFADELYKLYKLDCMERLFDDIVAQYDGDIETIESILTSLEDTHNAQLLIECDDEIIYTTNANSFEDAMAGQPNYSVNEIGENKLGNLGIIERFGMDRGTLSDNAEDTMNLTESFQYDGEMIQVSMVTYVASIENSADFFTNANIIISIIMLIVGLVLSLSVSRSITKPIDRVVKISSNLANLEFDEYISEEDSIKEVVSLARSINQLSRELKSKIEDLNQANEKLQEDVARQIQVEQMRREFIANVSHELKTPVAILQFYCQNLKSDIDGIDKEYYYDTIIEETERMDEMVKSLLDIASLENGLSKMDMEEMDLSEVVGHTVMKLQPLLGKFQVVVEKEDEILVRGNAGFLEHAIKNYITNAVSHTPEGGIIRITLKQIGAKVRLSVYNDGKHIDETQKDRIWESFYKSDKSRVREANTSVGLGLYIVKSIIENHEGNYGVSNVEGGVEFYFEILIIELKI